MFSEPAIQSVDAAGFHADLAAVTRSRPHSAYLYLMLRENAVVTVQWEQPGQDHRRNYRIISGCPHCAILNAVPVLAPILPLDPLRTVRARPQYETVLSTGRLPALAFACQAPGTGMSWLGDCHATDGDPHSPFDCADHAGRPTSTDPLDIDRVPHNLQGLPVHEGLVAAREWRGAAEDVAARVDRWADAAIAFLRTRCVLGVPVPGPPGYVAALTRDRLDDYRPLQEAYTETTRALSGHIGPLPYADVACLVPVPQPDRVPSYAGGVDVLGARPVRTIRLPRSPMSRLGRGILLLFEARYAMNQRFPGGGSRGPAYWENEAALNVFEFSLLKDLGREAYTAAVAAYLAELGRTGDLLDRPEKVLDRGQRKALAAVFGRIDKEELHLWGSVAYRNAIMLALGSQQAFAEHLRMQAER